MSNQDVIKSVFRWDPQQPKRMDPEFKKEWCAALRSDEYEQGQSSLKYWSGYQPGDYRGYRYCCLGVAADLKCDGVNVKWHLNTILSVWDEEKETDIQEESLLPNVLNKVLGLSGSDALVARWEVDDYYEGDEYPILEHVYLSLTDLNDSGHMSFNQIADIIEYFL